MLKKIKKNPRSFGIIATVISVCTLLFFINFKDKKFFQASAVDLVSILIGTIFTILLSEELTDVRRRNDCIEHIIEEIEAFISDDANFSYNNTALMKQVNCANKIKYIKDASFKGFREDIDFISDHFDEIRNTYSNHYQNETELKIARVDIDRNRDLIVDKCCKIRINLYT